MMGPRGAVQPLVCQSIYRMNVNVVRIYGSRWRTRGIIWWATPTCSAPDFRNETVERVIFLSGCY